MSKKKANADPTHEGEDIEISVSTDTVEVTEGSTKETIDSTAEPNNISVIETQTVTASSGSVDVTFDEDYSSTPTVLPVAKHSVETGVTIEDGTLDSNGCTILAENDVDIDVLVLSL